MPEALNIESSYENDYHRFNNITMYDSNECIQNRITTKNQFSYLFNEYAYKDTSGILCLIENDQNIYYNINIICNDNKGTHKMVNSIAK